MSEKNKKALILFTTNHSNNLLAGLNRQYRDGTHCDLELIVGKREDSIFVHRCLFSLYMQSSPMLSGHRPVDLSSYPTDVIKCLVDCIYTGVLMTQTDRIEEVLSTAMQLGYMDVVNTCRTYIEKNQDISEDSEEEEGFLVGPEPADDDIEVTEVQSDIEIDPLEEYMSKIKYNIGAEDRVVHALSTGGEPVGIPYVNSSRFRTTTSPPPKKAKGRPKGSKNKVQRKVKTSNKIYQTVGSNSFETGAEIFNEADSPDVSEHNPIAKSGKGLKPRDKTPHSDDNNAEIDVANTIIKVEVPTPEFDEIERSGNNSENSRDAVKSGDFSTQVGYEGSRCSVDGTKGNGESSSKRKVKTEEKEATDNIDMDKAFWKAVNNFDGRSDQERDSPDDQSSQMLSLGLKRKGANDGSEAKEETKGRRLRKRKKVDYSMMDGEGSRDGSPVTDMSQYKSSKVKDYLLSGRTVSVKTSIAELLRKKILSSSPIPSSSLSEYSRPDYGLSSTNGYKVEEKVIRSADKVYFPPAAIVPKGCNSRYARGIHATAQVLQKKISDEKGNNWVETMTYPERRTIYSGFKKDNPDKIVTNSKATYVICHPTKPVINEGKPRKGPKS